MSKSVLVLLFPLVFLVGCGGNPSVARHKQFVAALNEATDVMATVTDEASAKEARPRLVEIGERIRNQYRDARLAKDPGMDLETFKYDAAKYGKEFEEFKAARDRYGKEQARVSDVPGGINLVRTFNLYLYPNTAR
jgi:hypothetical protein